MEADGRMNVICYTTRRFDRGFRLIRWIDGRLCVWAAHPGCRWLYRVSQRTTDRLLGLWALPVYCEEEAVFRARFPSVRGYDHGNP
jgi:hypothetical protein